MLTGSGYVTGHLADVMSVEQMEDTMRFMRDLDGLPPVPRPEDPHKSITDFWPETDRLVYRMHFVEGYLPAEIQGCLSISQDQVDQSLSFARKTLDL